MVGRDSELVFILGWVLKWNWNFFRVDIPGSHLSQLEFTLQDGELVRAVIRIVCKGYGDKMSLKGGR